MENLIIKFIKQNINGVDIYKHNDSTWLIFTDDKKWVIELTNDKTLWYNYNFFKSIFNFFSMDVVENQHYITKWVEDTIINGVKYTITSENRSRLTAENIIENGVKETTPSGYLGSIEMKGKIVHQLESPKQNNEVEDAIQNGVKETNHVDVMKFFDNKMEGVLQNGVKETDYRILRVRGQVKDIIQNGVKETNATNFPSGECGYIREILRNGIKEVQPLPAQDGNRDWGNYYYRKGNPTKPFNEYLDDAIRFGVKETKTPVDGDIVSTVEWMKENNSTSYSKMIEDVIQSGKLNS
jgi:hypothetical protein